MTACLAAFVAGILGSAHCVGMCGPFAVAVGIPAEHWRGRLSRQLLYTFGRTFTYLFLGVFAAYLGYRFQSTSTWAGVASACLSIAAGLLLLHAGAQAAGWWPFRSTTARSAPCLAASAYAGVLQGNRWYSPFLAGCATGLIPCGLLYGMVTLAATTVNAWLAGGMMIAFGLGTAPVMIATALGGAYLGLRWRNRLFTIAGYWVVLLGLWTLAGGVEQLAHGSPLGPVSCPFCR